MSISSDGSIDVSTREYSDSGIVIVDISGEIDISSTPLLSDHLNSLIENHHYRIIANLENVSYISSTGWGLFISLLKNLHDNDGDLKLVALKEEVQDIFNMTSLAKIISSFKTIDDAAASFNDKKD